MMQNWRAYLIELVGTFFLVFTIALSGNPIAVGAILATMVYVGGHISGGYFNPAVVLAVLLTKRLDIRTSFIYMFFQLLGAVLAAAVFYLMAQAAFVPEAGAGLGQPLVITSEILFTFALALTVLAVTARERMDNAYFGLAIGLVIIAGGFAVGPISSAVFNPAVGLGTMLVGLTDFSNDTNRILNFLGAYLVAPFVGAALAAGFYKLTAPVLKK